MHAGLSRNSASYRLSLTCNSLCDDTVAASGGDNALSKGMGQSSGGDWVADGLLDGVCQVTGCACRDLGVGV